MKSQWASIVLVRRSAGELQTFLQTTVTLVFLYMQQVYLITTQQNTEQSSFNNTLSLELRILLILPTYYSKVDQTRRRLQSYIRNMRNPKMNTSPSPASP